MASKFFCSLTVFSLALSSSLFADESSEGIEGEITSSQPVDQKSGDEALRPKKPEEPKKIKPHFAGAKRVPESAAPPKKSRKIKNEWFSSKTQPKASRKETASREKESSELPEDRPHFISASNPYAPPFSNLGKIAPATPVTEPQGMAEDSMPRAVPETEGEKYPVTGFQAPCGHIFLTGEWLYWRTRQEGMEFATSREVEFDFQSGFRAGAGAHLPSFDGWTIYVNYTYFRPTGSQSAHGSPYPLFLFQGAGAFGSAVAEAHGHWRVGLQSLDVEFGKAYYMTETLVFSPFFGFKGAWIDQHAHFRYQGGYIPAGQTFRTHFKNDFKGAGPLAGTEMNWQLGAGFSFFGDLAAALIVGHFDNKQTQHQLGGVEVVHLTHDFNLVSPMLQMVAGIAWDHNFHRDQCHFGLSAGFETQYWWSQNQTEQFTDDVRPTYVRQKGDLAFYGLTLRARLDF